MKTIKSTYTWFIDRYKPETVLNKLSGLDIYNIKIEGYSITFDSNIKDRKYILDQFPNAVIIKKQGLRCLINKILNLSLILSLSLSLIYFSYLKSFIYKIELNGDYPSFENELLNTLDSFNLSVNNIFPSSSKLIELEDKILDIHSKQIEFIEIRRSGSILKISYLKRRKEIDLPSLKKSLYATKSGIIKQIMVKTGVVEVSINQYVKQGDLLVNDTLIDTSNNSIFIGCEGQIYAYTWYLYEVFYENSNNLSMDEIFIDLIDKTRSEVSKNIDGKDEYIEKENVLQFIQNTSKINLKLHYTLVEDITR